MIADRFFPVQKVLGVMHILSGIFVFCAPVFAEGPYYSAPLFLGCLLLHMLCYMPTVNLAAATAFHLLKNGEKQFPLIRLFGTLGWITAGIIVSKLLHGDETAMPMRIAGIGGMLMGLYCFTLPDIPPAGAGKKISFRDLIGVDAFLQTEVPFIYHFHYRTAAHKSSLCGLFFLCAGFSSVRPYRQSRI